MVRLRSARVLFVLLVLLLSGRVQARGMDPLPSWREGPSKRAITAFVEAVTTPGSPQFVPPAERIATFANDGTLWAEQPFYVQGVFALERVRALAPANLQWREQAIAALVAASHAGLSADDFQQLVRDWIRTARHPQTGRLYTQMVYQPMLELLAYLQQRGFTTVVVSGGGVDFMRPWVEQTCGIPPQQVIGSSIQMRFELRDGQPVLMRLPRITVVNDGPSKPVRIHQHIGRRPIAAFGNSDGDLAMLHHTDAQREWAYDRSSPVGRLDQALAEADARGWTVVDMRRDWLVVFPPPGGG